MDQSFGPKPEQIGFAEPGETQGHFKRWRTLTACCIGCSVGRDEARSAGAAEPLSGRVLRLHEQPRYSRQESAETRQRCKSRSRAAAAAQPGGFEEAVGLSGAPRAGQGMRGAATSLPLPPLVGEELPDGAQNAPSPWACCREASGSW